MKAGYPCEFNEIHMFGSCRDRLVCNEGYCWQPMSVPNGAVVKNRLVCRSLYINKNTSACSDAPKLQRTNKYGVTPCTVDTLDKDCIYRIGVNMYTATQLGKTCVCTKYSSRVKYFCELGEGDDPYIGRVKRVKEFMYIV